MKKKLLNDLFIFALLQKDGYTQVVLETVPEIEELLEDFMSNEYIWNKEEREEDISSFFDMVLNPYEFTEDEVAQPDQKTSDVIDSRHVRMVSSHFESSIKWFAFECSSRIILNNSITAQFFCYCFYS